MKYVITGGAGNISRPLTEKLLKAGQDVTVISRNAEHLKPLTDLGAKAAIGSVDDLAFLKKNLCRCGCSLYNGATKLYDQ